MFRRKPAADDPLLTADLPTRVQTAHSRLADQHDPALHEALSMQEIAEQRGLFERVREHDRTEQLAELKTAEDTAATVRKAAAALVRTEARDLVAARQALASQRRQSSPHAQLAELYRVKKGAAAALAGVVLAMMLFSATNVQHNLAPGGKSDPMFWMSYLLEAGLSVVLVVFMVTGSAAARWKITDSDTAIRITEIGLLLGSIYLNVYPYMSANGWDWRNIAAHGAAPVAMGIALIAHGLVAKRMGAAIAIASAQMPPEAEDDTAIRLAALTRTLPTQLQQPAAAATPARVQGPAPESEETILAEYERELGPRTSPAPAPALTEVRARTWAPAPADSADCTPESADPAPAEADTSAGTSHRIRTSVQAVSEPAPHQESADSAGVPRQRAEHADPAQDETGDTETEQVTDPAPVRTEAPALARTAVTEVPAPAVPRTSRRHHTARTSPALSAGAGAQVRARTSVSAGVVRTSLALAPAQSADLVRADATELAHEVRARRVGQRLPFETVVRVLEMLAADEPVNAIHTETKVHHKTIGNIRDTAVRIHAEAAGRTGERGRVIELRKPERP